MICDILWPEEMLHLYGDDQTTQREESLFLFYYTGFKYHFDFL